MNRAAMLAMVIDRDFQDENYFMNIVPPYPGEEDENYAVNDRVQEIPRAIQVMDFDMGLDDEEKEIFEEYLEADTDEIEDAESEDEEEALAEFKEDDEAADDEGYDDDFDDDRFVNEEEIEEHAMIMDELYGDSESWERSNDEGWYYDED